MLLRSYSKSRSEQSVRALGDPRFGLVGSRVGPKISSSVGWAGSEIREQYMSSIQDGQKSKATTFLVTSLFYHSIFNFLAFLCLYIVFFICTCVCIPFG